MRVAWGCLLVPPHSYNVINRKMSQESQHSVKTPQRQPLASLVSPALYFGLPYRFHLGKEKKKKKERGYCLKKNNWKPVPSIPSRGEVGGRRGKEAQTGNLTCLRSYSKSRRLPRDLAYQAPLSSLAFSSRPTFSSNDFFFPKLKADSPVTGSANFQVWRTWIQFSFETKGNWPT